MKILVTGGSGFIGSNFIHHIIEKYPDYEVVNLDALTYAGNPENHAGLEKEPRYHFVKGDILDEKLVDSLVPTVDVIVHFAAESHVDRSILGPSVFVQTNVLGTQILLESARKHAVKRFHHISTDEVFGHLEEGQPPFSEETPYAPRSPYSASKAASDHLVRAYHTTYGLPVTISNCSNNYGPYHFPEKFIPLAITNILQGKEVPLYGDGEQIRDWLHVKDHCEAIDLILHEGAVGETYCIGGGNQWTNKEIALRIARHLGAGDEVLSYVQDRPGHDRRYQIDFSKIQRELGWEPKIDLEEGLRETVLWYQEHEGWWKNVKTGEYLTYYEKQYHNR